MTMRNPGLEYQRRYAALVIRFRYIPDHWLEVHSAHLSGVEPSRQLRRIAAVGRHVEERREEPRV